MSIRFWIRLTEAAFALMLVATAIVSWRADRRDRAQLNAELAATKQLLAAADARQHDRDAQLAQTLPALAAEKRTIVTPAQIIRELPKSLPPPVPITLQAGDSFSVGARSSAFRTSSTLREQTTQRSPAPNPGGAPIPGSSLPKKAAPGSASTEKSALDGAFIPRADLKPLYDFTLDCKACQTKLDAAQNDLADERKKTAALTQERDDALGIARGGSVWRRIRRATKWFLIGAATGAIAAKAAH